MQRVRHIAPAKINLCLDLGPLRPDGYHEISSVLQGLTLADELEFEPADRLEVVNPDVPLDIDLVRRAAEAFERRTGRPVKVHVHVRKRIPMGAGLGGGSSDAATTLRAVRDLLAPAVPEQEILSIAAELGSDVPFFLGSRPLALAQGRGERLTVLAPRPESHVVVAWPDEPLSTAAVYGASSPGPGGATNAVLEGAGTARNDLTSAARSLSPACDAMLSSASEAGVPLVLTGSGSAAFALFDTEPQAQAALLRLRRVVPNAVLCRTLVTWPWQGNPVTRDE